MNIVALFDEPSGADAAAEALSRHNLANDTMRIVQEDDLDSDTLIEDLAEAFSTGSNRVSSTLTNMGMDQHDAEFYADAVEGGAILLVLELDDDLVVEAREVLEEAGAQQVHTFD